MILFEAQRQRREAGFYDAPRLDEAERQRLAFGYLHPRQAAQLARTGAGVSRSWTKTATSRAPYKTLWKPRFEMTDTQSALKGELEAKLERLRKMMAAGNVRAVHVAKLGNLAWLLCGGDALVSFADPPVAEAVVTQKRVVVLMAGGRKR